MTATMTRTRNVSATSTTEGSWSAIFPPEQVTWQQSLVFMKKLLAVAVSHITYLRGMLPENAFGDRCLEDITLKILKDDNPYGGAREIIKWVRGCFDALEKKYLKQIIIGMYSSVKEPETLLESYSFRFSYGESGVMSFLRNDTEISRANLAGETKKATITLLRTIIYITEAMEPLPDNAMMTMKLLYYDDVTPKDYEPPGFLPSLGDSFSYEYDTMNIKSGVVNTAFHTLKLRVKTDKNHFDIYDQQEQTKVRDYDKQAKTSDVEVRGTTSPDTTFSESHVTSTTRDTSPINSRRNLPVRNPLESDNEIQSVVSDSVNAVSGTTDETNQNTANEEDDDDGTVSCPCGCDEDDGLMVYCYKCKFWQHAICFKILRNEDAPENHVCCKCANEHSHLIPTDRELCTLTPLGMQATCLYRRAVEACLSINERVRVQTVMNRLGIGQNVAEAIFARLEKEGYIKLSPKGKRHGKEVNYAYVKKHGIERYLGDYAVLLENKFETEKGEEARSKWPSLIEHDPLAQVAHTLKSVNLSIPPDAYQNGNRHESSEKGRKRFYSEDDFVKISGSLDDTDESVRKKSKVSKVQHDLTM